MLSSFFFHSKISISCTVVLFPLSIILILLLFYSFKMVKRKHEASLRRKSGSALFRKRKFRGNQFTKTSGEKTILSNSNTSSTAPPSPVEKNFISSSAKKLKHIGTAIAPEDSSDFHDDSSEENSLLNTDGKELPHCFIFIDTDILKSIITLLAVCPDCNNKSIRIDSDLSKKRVYH